LEAQETVSVMVQILNQEVPEPIYCQNLQEAGVKIPSKFYFMREETQDAYSFVSAEQLIEGRKKYAAYTLVELKDMLPNYFMTGRINIAPAWSAVPDLQFTCFNAIDESFPHMTDPKREANAVAMMLIYLIAEGRISPEKPTVLLEKKKIIQLHQV